jgi:hypothetical protein
VFLAKALAVSIEKEQHTPLWELMPMLMCIAWFAWGAMSAASGFATVAYIAAAAAWGALALSQTQPAIAMAFQGYTKSTNLALAVDASARQSGRIEGEFYERFLDEAKVSSVVRPSASSTFTTCIGTPDRGRLICETSGQFDQEMMRLATAAGRPSIGSLEAVFARKAVQQQPPADALWREPWLGGAAGGSALASMPRWDWARAARISAAAVTGATAFQLCSPAIALTIALGSAVCVAPTIADASTSIELHAAWIWNKLG